MFPVQNTAPSRYPPLATWGLIAVNCAIFLVQIRLPPVEADALTARFALIPARYCCGNADLGPADFLPFFTMMFLHGGWLHLILNMWALWVFGGPVEDRLGPARYLLLYFACGVIAALTHYQFNPTSPVPALAPRAPLAEPPHFLGAMNLDNPGVRLVVCPDSLDAHSSGRDPPTDTYPVAICNDRSTSTRDVVSNVSNAQTAAIRRWRGDRGSASARALIGLISL
jgi:Rhomboid family